MSDNRSDGVKKEEIRQVLETLFDNKNVVSMSKVKDLIKDIKNEENWYTNKELFEKFNSQIEELNRELNKTQNYVKKYNNLMEKLTATERKAELAKEKAELAKQKADKLESSREGERQTQKDSREGLAIIISAVMMIVGVSSLIVTVLMFLK